MTKLSFDEYQERSAKTAQYPTIAVVINGGEPIPAPWLYPLLGLLGEAGELAEKFKKLLRDDQGIMTLERHKAIQKERGDPLWYLARLAEAAGTTMAEDAQANLDKLASRQERGTLGGDGDDR
jgi:NTP pyrophosphatase (non-canonical NTP hydrolase)